MALISMGEWIDRHGLDVEDDGDGAVEPPPVTASTPLHLVPGHAVRWRRHHEPLHATLHPRVHRLALRRARARRMRPALPRF
jgi:hypothetical protein